MENLYDALLSLQRIPNAYENWRDYRASLTAYITRQAPPGATAVLVGAGECNDLDLRRLAAHFSQLTLLDLNTDAMREGLKRQDADSAKIRLVEADLLGVTPDIYRETADMLLGALKTSLRVGGARPDAFADLFLARMKQAMSHRRPAELDKLGIPADYVVCCGVHSQLLAIFPQMLRVYRRYLDFDPVPVLRRISELNGAIASECTAQLLALAGHGLFLGLEEQRVGVEGGVEGAAQAIADVVRRGIPVLSETRLLWPFDPQKEKAYQMRILLLPAG